MKITHKILTYCVIGTVAFASQSTMIKAEETPIAGIDLVLHNFFENDEDATIKIKDYLLYEISNQYKGISFAKVSDYVNIRNIPSEQGEILGKLYNSSAATILKKSDDWYEVKSGSVIGYIKAEYLLTGKEAEELATKVGTQVALVTTDTLKVREEPTTDSEVLTLVANGDEFIVNEEMNGWVKIVFEGDRTGFVSADYVDVKYVFEEAISIKEEQERLLSEQEAIQAEQIRLAAEQKAILAEQRRIATIAEASEQSQNTENIITSTNNENKSLVNNENKSLINNDKKTANNSANNSSNNSSINSLSNEETTNSSTIRNKIVEYALRFKGNPYVWGGTSLTNGADCSGFIQSVFRDNGISIPRTSRTQAISGSRISIDEMQPGDLIFYDKKGTINHVGIYIGNGKIIAASSPETGIRITSYDYRQPYRVVSYIND